MATATETYTPRLKDLYEGEIRERLKDELELAKIEFAWRQGVRHFSFFNYGFLGEGRLAWLREIAAMLRQKESQ